MVGRHEGPRNLGEALSWYSRPEHAVARDSKRCPRAGMHGGHAAQEAKKPRLKHGGAADRRVGPLQPPSEEREHGPPSGAL